MKPCQIQLVIFFQQYCLSFYFSCFYLLICNCICLITPTCIIRVYINIQLRINVVHFHKTIYLIGGFCFNFSVIEDFDSVICIPTDAQDLFSPYIICLKMDRFTTNKQCNGEVCVFKISSLKIKFIAKFILHPKIAGNKCLIHLCCQVKII